ncbi:MAG: hypothetical protein HYU64_01615 [Armatimonadetes bacterium]|nr:hypothetical protein [Armatimonadota bacterium]
MSKPGAILIARIRRDLKELTVLVERAKLGWGKAKSQNDDNYLDGVALNLHGFYSGLEKIFEKIAAAVDGSVPTAANWHQELLSQMSAEIAEVRPAVISEELRDILEDYRGFRHVVRNVYTFHLNPKKIEPLIVNIDPVLEKLTAELTTFATFLQQADA